MDRRKGVGEAGCFPVGVIGAPMFRSERHKRAEALLGMRMR